MKKAFIFAAAAALVLAACSKNEVIGNIDSVPENIPIGFSNYAPRAVTKADAANYVAPDVATLVNDAQFKVWSWYTDNGTSFNGTNGTKFFNTWYTVTYQTGGNDDGTKNAYPDGLRYWPNGTSPKLLSFYAYYPSNKGDIDAPTAGLGEFSFTAKNAAADQVDFMVADMVKDKTYDNCTPTKGTVPLTFRHMLTKVVFQFKKTDVDAVITVTGASLSGVKNTGTLTTSYNGTDFSTSWGSQSGTQGYTVAVPATALTTTAATSGSVADDVFLMVPQNIVAGTQTLTITWTVKSGADAEITNTATVDLNDIKTSADAHIDWVKNSQVTYTITIGPKPIYFTGSVEGWTATEGAYTVE